MNHSSAAWAWWHTGASVLNGFICIWHMGKLCIADFFFFLPAFFSGLVAAPNTQLVLFWLWAHTVTSARTYLSMKMPLCQQALTCPHGYSESPADGQAVGVYRGTSPGLLHIWNKEASLGLPSVFTALLFFHTPRKILPKHTFQTHQLNMGEKKCYIFPL